MLHTEAFWRHYTVAAILDFQLSSRLLPVKKQGSHCWIRVEFLMWTILPLINIFPLKMLCSHFFLTSLYFFRSLTGLFTLLYKISKNLSKLSISIIFGVVFTQTLIFQWMVLTTLYSNIEGDMRKAKHKKCYMLKVFVYKTKTI